MKALTTREKAMLREWEGEDEVLALDTPASALPLLYLPRILTERMLPPRRSSITEVIREYGNVSIRLSTIDGKQLPFGAMAKKLLIYFCSRATQEKSRTVDMGATEKKLFSILGMSKTAKSKRLLREQIQRLAALTIVIRYEPNKRKKIIYRGVLFSSIQLEMEMPEAQLPLFRNSSFYASKIEFANDFYESIIAHKCMPFRRDMIAKLDFAFSLDLFLYLSVRLPNINHGKEVRLRAEHLVAQFAYPDAKFRMSEFSRSFEKALERVQSIWAEAKQSVSYDRKSKVLTMRYTKDLVPLKEEAARGW